ncbi:hypothetical protein GCM10008983_09640 [Lentibacillus halophilus]|uniref:ZP domain-containing protein n=1 Tax=Lentibacillus halophilus TaxID=295065 RepID=A0ABN0Z655_9BACI
MSCQSAVVLNTRLLYMEDAYVPTNTFYYVFDQSYRHAYSSIRIIGCGRKPIYDK